MELRTLKYLLSLFKNGSFTAAARANYITQPAISIQLKNLQKELGIKLYEIRKKRVVFTEAGTIVLDYAEKFAGLETQMLEHVRDMRGLKRGKLLLGTIDAASIYILPEVFSNFKELYPGVEINLEIASTVPLLKNLEKGGLDIVCGTLPLDLSEEYEVYSIYREPIVFIAPKGHPLAGSSDLNCSQLSLYPFILFHQESVTRRIVEETLLKKGVSVKVSMAIDSQEAIKRLVASGLGISALPLKTVEEDIGNGDLETFNVKGVSLEREIGLVLPVKRYLPITLRAFLEVVRHVLDVNLPDEYCLNGR